MRGRWISLQAKYAAFLLALIMGVIAGVGYSALRAVEVGARQITQSVNYFTQVNLLKQLEEEAKHLVHTLAENMGNPVYFLDIETINELLTTLKAVEDTEYAYLLDSEGRVVTDGTDRNPLLRQFLTDPFAQAALQAKTLLVQKAGSLIDVTSPIHLGGEGGTQLGWVRVGFSTARIQQETALAQRTIAQIILENRRQIVLITLGLSGLFSLLGVLMASFASGRLVHPIRRLGEAARRVGEGDFTPRMRVDSKDELGDLSVSFNKMIDALQRTTVSKEYVDQILANMLDTLLVVDQEARIRTVNRATCELLGFQEAELVGQPVSRVIVEEARAQESAPASEEPMFKSQALARLVEEGIVQNQELDYRARDGRHIPMLFSGALMHHQTMGRVAVTVARDITERKRAEAELARQAAELARSNQELEQFAYVASHDLREPLRKVASFAQLLTDRYRGRLDAQADKFIGYIIDGAVRMQALIEDLLAYSRVGRGDLQKEETDCNLLLQDVLSDLEQAIRDAHAQITSEPLPILRIHRIQMGQLLQNLISNAIKFHGPEPPQVHLSTERNGSHWRFSVRDNGIGIDPGSAERVFGMFQRLHTRAEYPGTGIGLAVCKKIVELHGGRIWLESAVGRGTTFYFTIPMG